MNNLHEIHFLKRTFSPRSLMVDISRLRRIMYYEPPSFYWWSMYRNREILLVVSITLITTLYPKIDWRLLEWNISCAYDLLINEYECINKQENSVVVDASVTLHYLYYFKAFSCIFCCELVAMLYCEMRIDLRNYVLFSCLRPVVSV